jgi:hypothetical protein
MALLLSLVDLPLCKDDTLHIDIPASKAEMSGIGRNLRILLLVDEPPSPDSLETESRDNSSLSCFFAPT